MFIKKIKNLESLPLVIMLVFIFFFLFTNFAQSKDIYFGATASDNIRVVGKLCIAGTCYASWPANPWSVSGTSVYYNVANGNVGIGKTNPTKTLDVTGTADFSGLVTAMTPQSPQGGQLATVEYVTSATAGMASYWTANGINIYSNNSGNIGIGIDQPIHKLSVAGTAYFSGITTGMTPTSEQKDSLITVEYLDAFKDDLLAQLGLCGGKIADEDGNRYGTVQIGGQCWMTENMRVGTMLASGATMPTTGDNIIEKWCYNNDPNLCETEGGLYHWDEAMRGSTEPGAQGICPTGWHIPTDQEWNDLEQYVVSVIASPNNQYPCDLNSTGYQRCADNTGTNEGANGVGQALRRTDKGSGVGKGTDLVGFKGDLPGRRSIGRTFGYRGSYLYLWSSSPSGSSAWARSMGSSYSTGFRITNSKAGGFSVRCLRD